MSFVLLIFFLCTAAVNISLYIAANYDINWKNMRKKMSWSIFTHCSVCASC